MQDAIVFEKNLCPDCLTGRIELYGHRGNPIGFLNSLERGALVSAPSFFRCIHCGLFFELDWTHDLDVPRPLLWKWKIHEFMLEFGS